MPEGVMATLADYAAKDAGATSLAHAALRIWAGGTPLQSAVGLATPDLLELLDWNPAWVAQPVITAEVNKLVDAAHRRLDAAAEGTIGLAAYDIGNVLGRLASHLPARHAPAIDVLSATVGHPATTADWQFYALEGLTALSRADRLDEADRAAIAARELIPGPK